MADTHDSPDFIKKLTKLFYLVGIILVVGTVVTVVLDVAFDFSLTQAAVIGLSVALVKAICVVAIFMHYKWDMKLIMITWTMLLSFFFFAGMIGLIMWAESDIPELHKTKGSALKPIMAAFLGLALPVSFAFLTVKVLKGKNNANDLNHIANHTPKSEVNLATENAVRIDEDVTIESSSVEKIDSGINISSAKVTTKKATAKKATAKKATAKKATAKKATAKKAKSRNNL